MRLPEIFDFSYGTILYVFFLYVLTMGVYQLYQKRLHGEIKKRSLIPVGAVALIFGIIAYIQQIRQAFEAIAEVGDISPSLVAGGISSAFSFPTLGLLTLGLAFLFKYFNQ